MLPEHEKEKGKEKRRDAKWSGGIFLFSKACMKNGRSLSLGAGFLKSAPARVRGSKPPPWHIASLFTPPPP